MQEEFRDGFWNKDVNSFVTVKSVSPADGNSSVGNYLECDSQSGNLTCRERVSHDKKLQSHYFYNAYFCSSECVHHTAWKQIKEYKVLKCGHLSHEKRLYRTNLNKQDELVWLEHDRIRDIICWVCTWIVLPLPHSIWYYQM